MRKRRSCYGVIYDLLEFLRAGEYRIECRDIVEKHARHGRVVPGERIPHRRAGCQCERAGYCGIESQVYAAKKQPRMLCAVNRERMIGLPFMCGRGLHQLMHVDCNGVRCAVHRAAVRHDDRATVEGRAG